MAIEYVNTIDYQPSSKLVTTKKGKGRRLDEEEEEASVTMTEDEHFKNMLKETGSV